MKRTIETIDIYNYSVPDEKGRVKEEGTKQAKEVFDALAKHLKDNGLYPDEYFLDSCDNYSVNNGQIFEGEFYCHTNFGGSEGLYIDIFQQDQNGKRVGFATAKTLQEGGDAFLLMSRIAAECNLMLNGYGNKYSLSEKESNFKEYYLDESSTTPYVILEQKNDIAILKRFSKEPGLDPTPFIIANGLRHKENDCISWDYGNYYVELSGAVAKFAELTEGKTEMQQVYLYSEDVEHWDDYCDAKGVDPLCSSLKIVFKENDVEAFDQNDNRIDDCIKKPINLINPSRGR